MENELSYTLDTSKLSYTKKEQCKQLDNRPLILSLYDRGVPYSLTGASLELRAKKPDGTIVLQTNNISVSSNVVTINPLNIDIVRFGGIVSLELKITKNSLSITTFTFELEILKGVIQDGDLQSQNVITLIEELDSKIAYAISIKNALETDISNGNIDQIRADLATKQAATDSNLTTTNKTVVGAINELGGKVGNIGNLTTTNKTSAVLAINELDSDIGNVSNLTTTAKTSAINAINELNTNKANKPESYNATGNNYTWYRKYEDGLLLVGGGVASAPNVGNTTIDLNVTLPITIPTGFELKFYGSIFPTDYASWTGTAPSIYQYSSTQIRVMVYGGLTGGKGYSISWLGVGRWK